MPEPDEPRAGRDRGPARDLASTPPPTLPRAAPPERFDRLDALRGVAIVWMAVFHLAFDLNHFGFIRENFYTDPFWTTQRTFIVSLFLFCAGFGQAVAVSQGQDARRFWRRWAQVAGCALLVSIGSALMFPRSWISFGVLHGMAVMLLLARPAAVALLRPVPGDGGAGRRSTSIAMPVAVALGVAAVVALALPQWIAHPWFDSRWTNPLGLVTRKPATEDYVPVLPWLGVMLAGLLAGAAVLKLRRAWLVGPLPALLAPLAALGRWSLSFYMLHQPVLIGALMLWLVVAGRPAG